MTTRTVEVEAPAARDREAEKKEAGKAEQPDTGTWSEETEGICPDCLRSVPARRLEENGEIWLRGACPRHGAYCSLLASDAAEYLRLRRYVPARVGAGCCGGDTACDASGPPVCVLLLEITLACNLRCPTCYADARGHEFMPLAEARRRLDGFFRSQPRLDVLMLSGGEPTIHPHFAEILALALAYPVGRVLINTNGLRLHQSDALVSLLRAHRDRVELFFSFSSFRPEVHERLYGRDLRTEKLNALKRAREANLFVTLVATIERGVNENEIGDLYRFALAQDTINGLNFQPVMSAGRYRHEYDAARRLTLTDILAELENQTAGELRRSDFVGLPCSHPDCCVLTYGFLDAKREHITPLPRHLDVAQYLDLFSDRISFAGLIGSATRRVWSDMAHLRGRQTLRDLALLFRQAGIRNMLPLIGDREAVGRRVFRVVIKPFMDAPTYDQKRIAQCCTKILTEQGEAVSFCAYNVLHRKKEASSSIIPLSLRQPVSASVTGAEGKGGKEENAERSVERNAEEGGAA